MSAHRSVIALVTVFVVSLWSVRTAPIKAADAANAGQNAQRTSDGIPDAWRNLPRVQVAVDGASAPERIPDSLAFRHFLKATASSASAGDIKRRALFLTTAGLSVADRLAFVNALGDVAGARASTGPKPSTNTTSPTPVLGAQTFEDVQQRILSALSAAGAAALRTHIQIYVKRRIVIYASPSAAVGAQCKWDQVSLLVEGAYSDAEGAWTVYSQADFGAGDCCGHQHRMELVASTQVSTYRTMATNTAAEITRVYDEPGPLEYHAGLWVECPGTGSVMSFGDPRVNGTKSRPRTLTIDSGTGVSTEETRSSTELSIPVTSGRARGGAGRVLVKLDTSSDVVIRQPVIIQLMIENRSGEALEFDLGDDQKANVQFQITRPDGVVTDVLRWRRGGLGGSVLGGRVVVPPLAVFTRQFLLDDWTTLDRPGQHAVRLAIDSIFRSSGGETLAGPVERTLMVRVGPRDDERLGRVCQRLAQLAIDGATAQDRGDAAHALAQVVDPIALPSVRRVLEATNWFDSGIARGLMRIGTDSARSLLDEMATSSQPERSSIARDTLRRWEAR